MVDTKKILKLLKTHFKTDGAVSIDPEGVVNVSGSVGVKVKNMPQIPVKFGKVAGHFFCEECGLLTLEGSPTWVGGDFWVQYNTLNSLEHAPEFVGNDFKVYYSRLRSLLHAPAHVGGSFECYGNPLTSLEGVPEHGLKRLVFTYGVNLPLLRCLTAKSVEMGYDAPAVVKEIIYKYAGTTNPADVLRCASELNEAGFEGNAEW